MEHLRTLREVCNELKISRRALQGYEGKRLITPSSRNKYGHLLYDEETFRRIAFIHFSQQLGFSINDISGFIDSPIEEIKRHIEEAAVELESRKELIINQLNHIEKLSRLTTRDEYLNEVLTLIKGGKTDEENN